MCVSEQVTCRFHPGKPVFHDGNKGWDCCKERAFDWDGFEKIEGCMHGRHNDVKTEVEFWKSGTVDTAAASIAKAEKLMTADDFNRIEEEKKKKLAEAQGSASTEKKP